MEGLNCGMQIQTRACSSGTWDLCTNKDMKKMLPCSDPDKEIEGCGKNNKTSNLFKYLNKYFGIYCTLYKNLFR